MIILALVYYNIFIILSLKKTAVYFLKQTDNKTEKNVVCRRHWLLTSLTKKIYLIWDKKT